MNIQTIEQIEHYADLLGREDPAVQKGLQRVALNPNDIPNVRDQFLLMLQKRGFDISDLPAFNIRPVEAGNDSVTLGNVVAGSKIGGEVAISTSSFRTPVLLAGVTGSGKTTLMMRLAEQLQHVGIVMGFFDYQDEYVKLYPVFPKGTLMPLRPDQDKDNPFEPSTGMSVEEWIERLIRMFREFFYLRDGSCNLLRSISYNVYKALGWFDGRGGRYPNVNDVISALQAMEFKAGTRQSGYLETLINRFSGLGPLLKTFDCEKGYPIEKLFERSVIFRLGGLSDDLRLLYTNLKIERLCSYQEKHANSDRLQYLLIIEEASKFCAPKLEMRTDLVEPSIFTLTRTIRKRGASLVFIEQVPSSLPYQLLGNVNTKIVLRLADTRSIYKIAELMVLNEKQAEQIPVLPFRQGILQSLEYPKPIMFQIPETRYDPVSEEQVQKISEEILATLKYVPSNQDGVKIEVMDLAESKDQKRGWVKVEDPHKNLLVDIKGHPYDGLSERRQRLGDWSPWYMGKVVNELEQIGFIKKPVSVSFGGRGNPKKMLMLTEKGAKFVHVEYESTQLKGKGSDEHKFLQNILADRLQNRNKNAFVEYCLNGKSADVVILDDAGKYHALEIELDPTNPHVMENVKRDLESFATCTVISRNQQAQNEIKSKVYKEISFQDYPRVKFELLKNFMS